MNCELRQIPFYKENRGLSEELPKLQKNSPASRELTLSKIVEAIIFAARENQNSHVAELQFASKLDKQPEIMHARLGRVKYACRMLDIKPEAVLLDVGSGIGLNSVLSLFCGVREVHSVEMSYDRLRSAQLIIDFLGLEDRVHLHGQDVLNLDLRPRTIDAAFSFELLEHISDIGRLYSKLALWLKDGGRVFGRTGANGRNLIYHRTARKIWDMIDKEHYVGVREEAIRSVVPQLPEEDLKLLVGRTRGELIDEVRRVAEEYRRNRKIPPLKSGCAPRDPLTAQYMERLLDPYETMRIINAQGFRTSLLKPNFRNITTVNPLLSLGFKAIGGVIRLGHPVSLLFAPWLEFLSYREPQPYPA
jgi:SAM-dependent methyltransferase